MNEKALPRLCWFCPAARVEQQSEGPVSTQASSDCAAAALTVRAASNDFITPAPRSIQVRRPPRHSDAHSARAARTNVAIQQPSRHAACHGLRERGAEAEEQGGHHGSQQSTQDACLSTDFVGRAPPHKAAN